MAASQNLARLREQTMHSLEDEEAVTVNTRALIDKVLARYSGEWTTLRELIQNAADAQARKVTVRFETLPSATIPLPQTRDPAEHLKHTLQNHTLKTLIVSNDGERFGENDWQRLKRIAEGNPDETKIGAFGVGFYSVFADCESPFVSSGKETMAFYWKKDSLFTRRGKLQDEETGTTFLLDYRSQTTPVPPLLGLCQFLATSLTFVGLEVIELYLDDWNILTLNKKMAPAASVKIPSDVNPKTRDGLMKITDVEYQNAQIDARWMNVVGWDRKSQATGATAVPQNESGGMSLRNFFGRFAVGTTSSTASRIAQREEEALQVRIAEDLVGISTATVFLRVSTVNILTNVSKSLAQELERATKKPPPKKTRISILTSSFDEASASLANSSGSSSQRANDIFSSVIPTKNGKIFIGFPTAQTTGLLAHISAPSVIPTVERESIDLNARYVRDWNIEMLRVAGIACRIAYTGEMVELKAKIERLMAADGGRRKVIPADVNTVLPSAIHTYKQFAYSESTPSARVGQFIEEAFWTCNQKASIDVLSTRGVLPSQQVRVATEDLSFVEGIPVIPDELMDKALAFLTKLRDYGLLSDITTPDIKKELEAQALTEKQVVELVKWASTKVSRQDMDASVAQGLFDGTIASIAEEHLATSASPVLQLGSIKTFVNSSKIPIELPTPPQTIPFRFTKGLSPVQLQSIGWEELQVVPWVRWIIESDGHGFGDGQSLTATPAVASQVLPVVSKAWDGLSQSSKQTMQELFIPRTVIPTKLGMRKPAQAYFGSVKLFEDLPTIVGLQGVKEKFLSALGVRKTVELSVVFDRLMAKSNSPATEGGKWSHVDLIKYLLSVKDDIPSEDLKRLRQTPICLAEAQSDDPTTRGKLYRIPELFEPDDAIKRLGLPVLQWPGQYRASAPEGRFLRSLGLQPYPSVLDLVDILSRAPADSELQKRTITYWVMNAFHNGYAKFAVADIDKAFLPVLPFAGEGKNLVAKPSQCYANPKAAVLRFRTLREDLQPHHALFGVALEPPIEACAERLIKSPPADKSSAQMLYGYLAGRLGEIGPNGNLAERLGNAPIVPVVDRASGSKAPRLRSTSPRLCFLGDGEVYGDIFDFVDFGHDANTFLLRVGCKHEPSATEIADTLVRQPTRLLGTLGPDKYVQLLRKIAENAAVIKKDKLLWQRLKTSPCLLAERLVRSGGTRHADEKNEYDDDETMIREQLLVKATDMVLIDDFNSYRLFSDILLAAPQEEVLENFYASLETPWLSKLAEDEQRKGPLLHDQSAAAKLQMLLVERCRLFLHDHGPESVRHDAKWLEQNLTVQVTEFLQVTRKLKGYKVQHTAKRSAALHRETKRDATLFVTARYDLYEVSKAISALLLKRPKQQDFLAFETILESDLRRLKTKGYNVDRILRQKAAESRIAESEMQKRAEEQRRLIEAESATRPTQASAAKSNVMSQPQQNQQQQAGQPPATPDKQLAMPGSFSDSPETARPETADRGKKPGGLFNTISKHLGFNSNNQAAEQMQKLLSGDQNVRQADLPPPYEASGNPIGAPGTGRATSAGNVQSNLQSAIKASREHRASEVSSAQQTKEIKETPTYCDHTPAQDIQFIAELDSGFKIYLSRDNPDPNGFLQTQRDAIVKFVIVLTAVAQVFELPPKTINIYHDEKGAAIAFNSNGALFCNLRYFMQLHVAHMASPEGKVEAVAYWWITLCHELAHNLVSNHDQNHSYYTESFAAHYFRRMVWLAGRITSEG
ncbi:H ATPase C domain protein [Zymoseptoria brevis]|uniref:H ATPase C domain protein n=1 Tax=Zymoseptoria brevis TaxID=1047168 RepID=A0A0F4GI86_9PEZI|nr:H ATPase C domain protein [Zymoseptoria brevis]